MLLDFNSCYCILLISKLTSSFSFHYLVFKHFPKKYFLIRMTFQSNLIFWKVSLASVILCNIIVLEDIEDIFSKNMTLFLFANISKFLYLVIFLFSKYFAIIVNCLYLIVSVCTWKCIIPKNMAWDGAFWKFYFVFTNPWFK